MVVLISTDGVQFWRDFERGELQPATKRLPEMENLQKFLF